MSASLNTVAGTVYQDFARFFLKDKKQTEATQNVIIKLIILMLGLFCVLMVFVVERMGAIFQMAMTLVGLTYGTLLGVFSLGIFFPRANSKGAVWGAVVSLVGTSVVVFGSQYYKNIGLLQFPGKVTSVQGCPAEFTASLPFNASVYVQTYQGVGSPVVADDSVPLIFQLSYMYYAAFGTMLALLVGVPVSYLTGPADPRGLDPKLFAPPVRRYLPQTRIKSSREYTLVNTNLVNGLKDTTKHIEVTSI